MMTELIIALMGVFAVCCFAAGAGFGRELCDKGKKQKAVPFESIFKHEKPEALKEAARLDSLLQNIEAYDGTPQGQTEI